MGRVGALDDPFYFAQCKRLIRHASRDTFPRRGRLESNVCSHYAEGSLVASGIYGRF